MTPGLSTACFYPLETEKSLLRVGELGFHSTEVFFNSSSELEPSFLKKLSDIKKEYGISINSLHPMASFAESYMLFSTYERRFYDTMEIYKRYYDAANILGARIVVIHGSKVPGIISPEQYYERFAEMIDEGRRQGVIVAHENVVNTAGQSPQSMLNMKEAIGDNFKIVFDIKQSVRSGFKPQEFADALGDSIVQVHISDHSRDHDCIPPGEGNFDFKSLFDILKKHKYSGDYIIELYRKSFENDRQLIKAKQYIENIS